MIILFNSWLELFPAIRYIFFPRLPAFERLEALKKKDVAFIGARVNVQQLLKLKKT
jgi:hypothetical protein